MPDANCPQDVQIRNPIEVVERALRLMQSPARRATLEITETVIMQQTGTTLGKLQRPEALSVRLTIDNFATEYSSLRCLQTLPIDILKIDPTFVEGVARGDCNAELARTIIVLGQTLGLRTVAESVEDVAQRDELRRLGCQLGQRSMPAHPTGADATSHCLTEVRPRVLRQVATWVVLALSAPAK